MSIKDWRPHGPERGPVGYGPNQKLDCVVATSILPVRILNWLSRKRRPLNFVRLYVYIQQDGLVNVIDVQTGEVLTTTVFPILAFETTLN